MLKTISGNNSLILFDNNRNKSNIFEVDNFLLKENYFNVFNDIYTNFKNSAYFSKFTSIWHEICNQECYSLTKKLEKLILSRKASSLTPEDKNMIEKIVVKFRGNLGEIFAEAFFTEGYLSNICKPNAYNPVDPQHEKYIDADSISSIDGMPIGIQVKNYNLHSKTEISSREIFDKASTSYLQMLSSFVEDSEKLAYLTQPRQIIFSFTEIANELILNDYSKFVIFIGPKEIDSKGLQGCKKKNLPANWLFFKTIADEIMCIDR